VKPDPEKIKALGVLESYKNDIEHIRDRLQNASFWLPGKALRKECDAALQVMHTLEEQFDRKLIVTIVGPGGSGKSTLFNALSGRDDISRVGTDRPTTKKIVVACGPGQERDFFVKHFGADALRIHETSDASQPGHLTLIDTPDVDSTQQAHHIQSVQKAIELSDILLCIFNAENPKTKDHVDFFAPYIKLFHGESIVGILNKCDRIDEMELKNVIRPQFETYIQSAWGRSLESLLLISARRNLHSPNWDEKARPKHDFDQFESLMRLVTQTFNRPGYAVDRRLNNALQLRKFILAEVEQTLEKDRNFLMKARSRLADVEKAALTKAFSQMKQEGTGQLLGINVLMYQKIAQRWVGPVGWMIAIWARILIFGTGVMAIFRFGNPIRQIIGIVSSLRHFKDTKSAIAETENGEQVGASFQTYRVEMLKTWPEISELLIKGRFDKEIRNSDSFILNTKELNTLSGLWRETLDGVMENAAKRFSNFFLQILLNLPTLALLAHAAWLTAKHYFSASYLSSDFFLHAFLTIAIILLLSFFIFQAMLRLGAGSERLMTRAFQSIKMQLDPFHQMLTNPVLDQINVLLRLTPDA
jgi:energy-coupling factor transporter ATP-binding protein EcfA2